MLTPQYVSFLNHYGFIFKQVIEHNWPNVAAENGDIVFQTSLI